MNRLNEQPLAVASRRGLRHLIAAESGCPQLLVSVRNADEARAALAGGCTILDVKEPARGALGRADSDAIQAVIAEASAAGVPVTAALGECRDWLSLPEVPMLPQGLYGVKLGVAGLGAGPEWRSLWERARSRVAPLLAADVDSVAVVYADWQQADAPSPRSLIEAAIEEACSGVLFDTFTKGKGSLLDFLSADELHELATKARDGGLFVALAGSLRCAHLPALRDLPADVIAVRSAACRAGVRMAAVDAEATRELRTAMRTVWSSDSGQG